jgi:hypothetical protein
MAKLYYLMMTVLVIFSCSHKTEISTEPQIVSDTIPGTPAYVWTQVLPFGMDLFLKNGNRNISVRIISRRSFRRRYLDVVE